MVNDTTTLNGSLQQLGENLATNITSKGVTASADDGLTTLASKILQIQTGGGASNIVQGSFTTGSTGGSVGTLNLNYTGNGYPIVVLIYVKDGMYNSDSTWYQTIAQYDIGVVVMIKANTNTTPTYTSSGVNNYGTVSYVYKSSTSSATSYGRSGSNTINVYTTSSNNASSGNSVVRFKGNGTTLSYYVGNRNSSYRGLARDTTFGYIILYSE